MTIMRLTGTAGRIYERSGTSGEGDEKRSWTMRSQDVEIGTLLATRVDLQDDDKPFEKGEAVDVACEVTVSKGYLRINIKGDWPKPEASRTPAPVKVPASV